eukprot:9401425-Alexandrium_andersonii.AAC.1
MWADSSPQHGVDWLLSHVMSISPLRLSDCMDAVRTLAMSQDAFMQSVPEHRVDPPASLPSEPGPHLLESTMCRQ